MVDVSEPDRVSGDIRRAGVLDRILRSPIFEAIADETLGVVSDAEEFGVAKPPVNLAKVDVLVLSANPGVGACLKITEGRLLIGSRSGGSGHPKKDEIGEGVVLAGVIEEEKKCFAGDRTREVTCGTGEVIAGLLSA